MYILLVYVHRYVSVNASYAPYAPYGTHLIIVICNNYLYTYVRLGSTEAIGLTEYIMEHIAYVTKQDPVAVRLANLNAKHSIVASLIDDVKSNSDYENRKKFIVTFNEVGTYYLALSTY